MGEETELLIEEVRKYEYLYDTSHNLYKNMVKKAETWTMIAGELNMTSDAAKAKWKNLRDSCMRYKKSVKGMTGQAKKYQKWPWSEHMQFLDDTLRSRSTNSNIQSDDIDESIILDTTTAEHQGEGEECEPQIPEAYQKIEPPPPKKKKINTGSTNQSDTLSPVNKIINYLQNKPARREYDGIDHLFLSYADTFRKFNPRTQAMLKMELATLFARTEMRELHTPLHSPTQSPFQSDKSSSTMPCASEDSIPVYHTMNPIGPSTSDSYATASDLFAHYQL